MDPEKLKEVKSSLRSLLITQGSRNVTLKYLNQLYREFEEEDIPFKKFGYSNLLDFLRSIPDTLKVYPNTYNELCAYHVETEETAHISALIARQKPNTKKRSKSSYPYRSRSTNYNNYNYNARSVTRMPSLDNFTQILNRLRQNAKRTSSGAIRKCDVLNEIREKFNLYDKYTIDMLNNQLGLLNQMIKIDGDLIYFKEDLAKSRTPHVSNNFINYQKTITNDHYFSKVNSTNITNGYRDEQAADSKKCDSNLISKTVVNNHYDSKMTSTNITNGYSDEKNIDSNNYDSSNLISKKHPVFNNPVKTNGFDSMQSEAAVTNNTSSSNNHSKLNSVQNKPIIVNVDNNEKVKSKAYPTNDLIREKTRIRLQNLSRNHPEGVWVFELPSLYKREYGIDLEYQESGFNNITEFVAAIPDIFRIVEPPGTNKQMVLSANQPAVKSEKEYQTKSLASVYNFQDYVAIDPEPVPLKLSSKVTHSLIPDGVMNIYETVDHIIVSTLAVEEYVEVCVSEIFNPSFFWIIFRQNRRKVKDLMSELGDFYNNTDLDEFRIPQVVLQPGLNVVCVYAKIWHRAVIKKIKPDGYVVIFFYDYGTVKTYHPNDLYFMKKKFSLLPSQAIACSLYNVRPINSNFWPPSTTTKFVSKVWNVPLVAIVISTDDQNNTMSITLTDTSDDQVDLHINDWLVENKLARYGRMDSEIPLEKIHLFDEDILLDKDQNNRSENERRQSKVSFTESEKNISEIIELRENHVSPQPSISCTYSSFDIPKVVTLIKENRELIQQTNTITQAILLNMSKEDSSTDENSESQYESTDTFRRFETDLNRNLNSIQISIPEMNDQISEYNQNESFRFHPNERPTSELSSISQQLPVCHNEYTESEDSYLDRKTSILSSYHDSSTQKNNVNEQLVNGNRVPERELDKISDGGTLYFKVVNNNDIPKKRSITIKYPEQFASTMNTNSVNANVSGKKKQDVFINREEVDEGYSTGIYSTSKATSNTSNAVFNAVVPNSCVFTVVYLSERCAKKQMHIFHMNNEGWVSANEIVDAFTNLKYQKVMFKLLDIFQHKVNFKHLTRETDPQLFSQLDKSKIEVPRGKNNKIVEDFVLIIMPLKAVLQTLVKLDFLDTTMLKEALPLMKQCKENAEELLFNIFNNRILYDVLNLPVQYGQFKRVLRSSKK